MFISQQCLALVIMTMRRVLMSLFTLESFQKISVDLLRVNPDRVYVFEDTMDRSGSFGQAAVRQEPNACGIPVRKSPGLTCKAVFSDQDHEFEAVTEALRQLYRKGRNRIVVFPHVGIGHGPYGLVKHSPRLYSHVCQILKDHFGYQQPSVDRGLTDTDQDALLSRHQQVFAQVCTRGGINMASVIAQQHGLTLEELKTLCFQAGAELEAQARLFPLHRPIYRWASSEKSF
jgi:hypothetical protein